MAAWAYGLSVYVAMYILNVAYPVLLECHRNNAYLSTDSSWFGKCAGSGPFTLSCMTQKELGRTNFGRCNKAR